MQNSIQDADEMNEELLKKFSLITQLSAEEMRHHHDLLINAFDINHRVLFWNKKCEMLFGIPEENALGNKLEDILPGTKGNEKLMHLNRALMGKEVVILKGQYERKNGYYDQRVVPVTDHEGKVIAAINIVKDRIRD